MGASSTETITYSSMYSDKCMIDIVNENDNSETIEFNYDDTKPYTKGVWFSNFTFMFVRDDKLQKHIDTIVHTVDGVATTYTFSYTNNLVTSVTDGTIIWNYSYNKTFLQYITKIDTETNVYRLHRDNTYTVDYIDVEDNSNNVLDKWNIELYENNSIKKINSDITIDYTYDNIKRISNAVIDGVSYNYNYCKSIFGSNQIVSRTFANFIMDNGDEYVFRNNDLLPRVPDYTTIFSEILPFDLKILSDSNYEIQHIDGIDKVVDGVTTNNYVTFSYNAGASRLERIDFLSGEYILLNYNVDNLVGDMRYSPEINKVYTYKYVRGRLAGIEFEDKSYKFEYYDNNLPKLIKDENKFTDYIFSNEISNTLIDVR